MDMVQQIEAYLASKSNSCAASTLSGMGRRLKPIAASLNGDPHALWAVLEAKYSPYTRVTLWVTVTSFWDWMIEEGHTDGPNRYTEFRKRNRNFFKNTYARRAVEFTYEEVREKVLGIDDDATREKALQLLTGGLRYTESKTLTPDGYLMGKGASPRKAYVAPVDYRQSYSTFLREMKKVGITPHVLRKVTATKLGRVMDDITLMEVFGWKSIETSKFYRQPMKEAETRKIIDEELHGSITPERLVKKV